MGIFTTAVGNKKNTVKFSIKIPHFTSTVHRLLSDRLLCFLGLLYKNGLSNVANLEMDNLLKWVLLKIASCQITSAALSCYRQSKMWG